MSCNCTATNAIPAGAQTLHLGTYIPNRQLNVYFTTATGRVDIFPAITTGLGIIQLATPRLRLNTAYEVTIAERSDELQRRMPWNLNNTSITCASVTFNPEALADGCFTPQYYALSQQSN